MSNLNFMSKIEEDEGRDKELSESVIKEQTK